MNWKRRVRVGLAVDASRLLAVRLDGAPPSAHVVLDESWDPPSSDRRAQFTGALKRASRSVTGAVELSVVLLPPLAESRFVLLPPLASDDLRPVLVRDLSRYLPAPPTAPVVEVDELPRDSAAGAVQRRLVVADEALIEDILAAAASAGCSVHSITDALPAWQHAARAKGIPRDEWAVVSRDDRTDAFRVTSGTVGYRRLNRPAAVAQLEGVVVAGSQDEALLLAAQFADGGPISSLWTARVRAERVTASRRTARRTAAAALLLVLFAFALEWRGMTSALQRTQEGRDAIAAQVRTALARRDSLSSMHAAVDRIRGFEAAAPDWLALIAEIEGVLPDDAYLVSLRGVKDSLVFTGEAERAAPVLEAFTSSAGFRGVRLDAPIQQHVEEGEVIAERFTLVAQPRPRGERP